MTSAETVSRRWRAYLLERLAFIYKNALACLFPVGIFALLAASRLFETPLPRYDFLLIGCLALQILMVATGLESWDELKVILVFHALGLGLELFKTQVGSWSYPEASYLKIGGVPLYSGFMYASVASFMCQAYRRFELRLENWPAWALVIPLGAAIYLNFFSHHYLPDLRWLLTVAVVALFWRTRVTFVPYRQRFALPLPWAFAFIGLFVWLAENVSTALGAWVYPEQRLAWRMVGPGKIVAWSLLVIVSFMIVAQLKRLKAHRSSAEEERQQQGEEAPGREDDGDEVPEQASAALLRGEGREGAVQDDQVPGEAAEIPENQSEKGREQQRGQEREGENTRRGPAPADEFPGGQVELSGAQDHEPSQASNEEPGEKPA